MEMEALCFRMSFPEDGGDTRLRNVGNSLQDYMVTWKKTTVHIFTVLKTSYVMKYFYFLRFSLLKFGASTFGDKPRRVLTIFPTFWHNIGVAIFRVNGK
jgi:hypothetical protein